MKKLKILLDLDNTVLFYSKKTGKIREHPQLQFLLDNYEVVLYSASDDIKDFAEKWNVQYVWKGENRRPSADFLIDDAYRQWLPSVTVKKGYSSINRFLKTQRKEGLS